MTKLITRVYFSGENQLVDIPKEFFLEAEQVEITRNPAGQLILRPVGADRAESPVPPSTDAT